MSTTEILVTGGTGVLGRRVAERLHAAGVGARVLSRGGRPGTVRGDLLTGEGLDAAVDGVDTIVHCASSPYSRPRQVDVEGTRRLLRSAAAAGVSHVVYISIVGIDLVPSYPYYRVKLETERVIEGAPIPYTILRATQFYDLVLMALRSLDRLPVMPIPAGFLGQPIDAGEVAGRLAELALSPPAGRAPDMGGPEVRALASAARGYLGVLKSRKRVVEFPFPGRTARAIRAGALTCPDNAAGKIRWEDFLREKLRAVEPEGGTP
ncbi:NAD(P)H-binding protein [Rubrobacter tropicus]|uniref:NAD(P)H-binding protein n=1 Tax=Rubrobacter tropicus TaxID=2653851 RepID=A0A6G8Q6C3_9ACTN|nr:NAD(P)H-binding protein [Rubrobacter tropicus]QIN82031.1 NAD(P)H-binding protein [Rubrobacter tropicus]